MFAEEMTTILLCWGIKLLLLLCSVNAQDCQSVNDSQSLEFLYMTSFGASLNSSGSVVGMMMALDKINRNSSLLPNYTLGYSSIVDSQVSLTSCPTAQLSQWNYHMRILILFHLYAV